MTLSRRAALLLDATAVVRTRATTQVTFHDPMAMGGPTGALIGCMCAGCKAATG